MRLRRLVFAALLAASCVIVVDPGGGEGDANLPKPLGNPDGGMDLGGLDLDGGFPGGGGGGDKGDGGGGGTRDGGSSGSLPGDGTVVPGQTVPASALFLVRIDRGTANLASAIDTLVKDTTRVALARGIALRTIAVAPLYGAHPTFVWAKDASHPPPASLADTLRYYADRAPAAPPTGCSTDTLFELGQSLTSTQVVFATEFGSQHWYPFRDPTLLFVALIDPGERPQPEDACGAPHATLTEDPPAWLTWSDDGLTRTQTRYALIATREGVDVDAERRHCLEIPGFPRSALDAIAPSPTPFYDPLTAAAAPLAPGLVQRFDFCAAFGGEWSADLNGLIDTWVRDLQAGN